MERTVGSPHSGGDRVAVSAVVVINDPVENGWVHDEDVVVSRCA